MNAPRQSRWQDACVGDGVPGFLRGGGEMGQVLRGLDWSGSSLGPPARWPQALRTVVRLMLNTGHPIYVFWGPDHACLYNDAFRESIGPEQHPSSLGRPARQVWDDVWPVIGPQIEQVMSGGGATWHVDQRLPITRHGARQEVYWTYSYSPIDDETTPGGIGGVLVVCNETTRQVQAAHRLAAERDRLARLFEQAPTFMGLLSGPEHRIDIANPVFQRLAGGRPILGRTVREALPEAIEQGYGTLLDSVFASGEAYTAAGANFTIVSEQGARTEHVVDFVYQPFRDADGSVAGIFVHGADVTLRHRAELALRESEASFRSALKAGRLGSWQTDYVTMTRQWSQEGMALFGLDLPGGRGQVGGPHDEYANALHPDDRHLVQQFHDTADRQDSFVAEYRIIRPDGRMVWLSGRGLVVARGPDGRAHRLVSVVADATDRYLAQEALRIGRERLSLALSAGRMGAYDLDIVAGHLWWSSQMYALFGVSEADFTPTPASALALLAPQEQQDYVRARAAAIEQHQPFTYEFRVTRADGSAVWLVQRGQAEYDAQGRPVRSFGVIMDISDRKQAEQMLREADQRKDNFIATLAHELRNPLAPIRNAVDLLRRGAPADARTAWCHDVIERQTGQMAHLLDDLLDVSRLTRGQLRLRREPLLLATVVEQAIEIAQPLIDRAGHTLSVTLPPQPLQLDGDLIRLSQVFSNLLINAAKYTPPRGRISLGVEQQADWVVVTVADTGIGIATEHLSRIFEIFGQVESALNRSQGGQGIGLALGKGLVEMHGGTIEAHSPGLGQGSEFTVRLPLAGPAPAAGVPVAAVADSAAALVRQHILVVDDMRDTADSLAMLLQSLGHRVDVAYDGAHALQLAETLRPDIVLLDIGMPRLSGYEVCRRIRAAPWGRDMTLIAQTGWGQQTDRAQTQAAGFDHHLVKPVDPGALLALLASVRAPPSG